MAIDSLCQCILFSSQGTAKTREWSRFEGVSCINQEKLKFYTLKNPPGTVKTAVASCASAATTVTVGGRTFAIDRAIFAALAFSLAQRLDPESELALQKTPLWPTLVALRAMPVTTGPALLQRIRLIRALLNQPVSTAVRLEDAPLVGWHRKYTYNAGNNDWPKVVKPDARDYQFKAGAAIDVVIGNFPILSLYQEFFYKRKFVLQNAQYFYVAKNNGCDYASTVPELLDSASNAAQAIIAVRPNQFSFTPIVCLMKPASAQYPTKFGLLFAINADILSFYDFPAKETVLNEVAKNSQFIFLPAQTQQEVLENKDLPVDMGVTFPLTNGGYFSRNFIKSYNSVLAQYYLGNIRFKTLRPNVSVFHPQLRFPDGILPEGFKDILRDRFSGFIEEFASFQTTSFQG